MVISPSAASGIAARIVGEIEPASVLHVWCDAGVLVQALRKRGVEAFGLAPPSALAEVQPAMLEFCRAWTAGDSLWREFDLVVVTPSRQPQIAVEGALDFQAICAHTDDLVMAGKPEAYEIAPALAQLERLTELGFFWDADYDAAFVAPGSMRFRRSARPLTEVIAAYEARLWESRLENELRRRLADMPLAGPDDMRDRHEWLSRQELAVRLADCEAEMAAMRGAVDEWSQLRASPGWGVLQTMQQARARVAPPGSRRNRVVERLLGGRRPSG